MKRRWVIPDTHGCVKTVEALFANLIKPARNDEIYFLGDYIDRGPDSKGVINFIRNLQKDDYPVIALKGNHEDMAVELYDAENSKGTGWINLFSTKKQGAWLEMGGSETLKSYGVHYAKHVPADHIEWMRALPYYVNLDEFVLVHAGLNFKNADPYEDKLSMLWLREYEIKPEKIGFRRIIHGHMPVNLELITQTVKNKFYKFIDLDNGIYIREKEGYGNLVALELNSMEFVIQDNLDI
jgi:serine/threonine protein phosphatase 1